MSQYKYPLEVRERIKRRAKKKKLCLPSLSALDRARPTWDGLFIGYNIKLLIWKRFLTPKDIQIIAAAGGHNLQAKNISLAFGGRPLMKKDYDALCSILRIDPGVLRRNIAKRQKSDLYVEMLLHRRFRWDLFLGPIEPSEAAWCKEQFMKIARYAKSQHLPRAQKIIELRHKKLSARLSMPIAKNTAFR